MGLNDRKLQEKDDRKHNSKGRNPGGWDKSHFIGFSPTKEEKERAKGLVERKDFSWANHLITPLELGYKFSLKWSDKGQAYCASLVGGDSSPNPGMVLSAYHSDPNMAVAAMLVATFEKHDPGETWATYQTGFDNDW